MNSEFEECLKKKKIWEFSRGTALVAKELEAAESDLNEASQSFSHGSFKWAIIQSYYSMFHSGRALLYSKNYREKSHYCLIVALRTLYVEERLLPLHLVEALLQAKALREEADYNNTWSTESAETLILAAKEFLGLSKKLSTK